MAGGLARTGLAYADLVGAEAAQVFVTNPKGWAPAAGDPRQDDAFREECARRGLPVFVHAPYLVNLGAPDPGNLDRSVAAVRHALCRAARIGARGVVVHAGSAVAGARREPALGQVRERLLPLLDELATWKVPGGPPRLLIEPSAGSGQALAATVAELGDYLDRLDRHPMVGVTIDTCHLFAAGHDLARRGGMTATLDELATAVGADRLDLIHANDSADACGSRRDRHAGIGRGRIGLAAFRALLRHPVTRGVPVVVETPADDPADHARDVATLKGLRRGAEPPGR